MAVQQLEPIEDLSPRVLQEWHHEDVVDFLSRDVPANLFQLCWLENHGMCPIDRPELFRFRGWLDADCDLHAVSLLITDRLALVEARTPEQARRVGRWYREHDRNIEHVVSRSECVAPFWRAYSGEGYATSRLDRDQVMYRLERDDWPTVESENMPESTGIRYARMGDVDALFAASAQMHHEETLQDPLEQNPESFREHVRHRIESNRSFVWFDRRQLVFKADVSARGSFGVQISGVFTVPEYRGRGVATRAMTDICRHLFDEGVPRIVLYVNRENHAARRVYSKVGFLRHTDYRTVFVAD
jgi:predicted GNAT family acetyltransferase